VRVECYIFLFNDALLITAKNKGFMANANLIYKYFISLSGANAKPLADSWGTKRICGVGLETKPFELFFFKLVVQLEFTNCLELSISGKSTLIFTGSDSKDRDIWASAINESASSLDSFNRRLSMRTLSGSLIFTNYTYNDIGLSTTYSTGAISEALSPPKSQSKLAVDPTTPTSPSAASLSASSALSPTVVEQAPSSIESILEEAILLQQTFLNMPKELQSLLVPHLQSPKLLDSNHLFEMKEKLAMLRNKQISDDVLTRLESSEVHKVLADGKLAMTDLKNFVVTSFPTQSNEPKNNSIRQLVLRLMKWFMTLEKLLRDTAPADEKPQKPMR